MSVQDHTAQVEYREIPEVVGYRFGSDGTVWSKWGRGRFAKPDYPWRLLKCGISKRGYVRVTLNFRGRNTRVNVHTMILTAFRGPCPDGMECRHLDGNRANPRLDNLAWGTPVENVADQFRHGTHCVGEQRNSAKLTEEIVREIRRTYVKGKHQGLAKKYGVAAYAIHCIVTYKTWKHVT